MKYKVKYEDNSGHDCIMKFNTKEEAENAIEEDLENCKKYCQSLDYADFGNKTEFWVPGEDVYASWERLWK